MNCPSSPADTPAQQTPFDPVPPPGKLESGLYWLCIFLMAEIVVALVYAIANSGNIEFGCIK